MNINTKQIKKGIITIDGKQIKTDMSIPELASVLQREIKKDSDYVGYTFGEMIEDGKPMSIVTWFEGDNIRKLELRIGGFHTDDHAFEYLDTWLEERGITEWVGESYYKTEFGSLIPSLIRKGYGDFGYELGISLEYSEIPTRKFSPIKENTENSVKFIVDDLEYKIQRIPYREADELPFLNNWLGNGPHSLNESNDRHSKDDRKEIIYFNISEMENNRETVLGIAQFTYFAVWEIYKKSNLFMTLDNLTEEWGIIGFAIEKYGCGLIDKKGITPYILVFDTIHDEIPYNKELKVFTENKENMKLLYKSAMRLASKYVKTSEENMTLINISKNKDDMFSYYKTIDDVFINYQRSKE